MTTQSLPSDAQKVLDFWFEEIHPSDWWRSEQLDTVIEDRFLSLFKSLEENIPNEWRNSPKACLAAIIVLDQFPRNIFRGNKRAYANDSKALEICKKAIREDFHLSLSHTERVFLYIPLQHSENVQDQELSLQLYSALEGTGTLDFVRQHKEVIDKFGRFPQRNRILGRTSTPDEVAFLEEGKYQW